MDKRNVLRLTVVAMTLFIAMIFAVPDTVAAASKKPARVTNVSVKSVTYQSVTLKWDAADRAGKYEIYRSLKKDSGFRLIKTVKVKTKSYTDTGLDTGTKYWYKVRAVNKYGNGKKSKCVCGVPALEVPKLKLTEFGEGIRITVKPVAGAEGYILLKDDMELLNTVQLTYMDTDLAVNQTCRYAVRACRTVNKNQVTSEASEEQTATRPAVSIKLKKANDVDTPRAQGSPCTIKGKVVSNTTINKISVGVKYKKTETTKEKWVSNATRYVNENVNALKFDIADADSSVKFGKLKTGDYYYVVKADLADGTGINLKKQEFQVVEKAKTPKPAIPTDFPDEVTKGARKAVQWAVKIANDDSFAYGKGHRAHHGGCYFCGTNVTGIKKAKKGSKWEKTYCCNPFIFAAYAHGAKDKNIKAACKKGKCGGMEPYDWTKYGCFALVGKAKNVPFKKLLPGDVILSNKKTSGQYHHVIMYIGDNKYVEAGWEGWGASTIGVRSDAKNNYKKHYQKYKTCYVMRYTGK